MCVPVHVVRRCRLDDVLILICDCRQYIQYQVVGTRYIQIHVWVGQVRTQVHHHILRVHSSPDTKHVHCYVTLHYVTYVLDDDDDDDDDVSMSISMSVCLRKMNTSTLIELANRVTATFWHTTNPFLFEQYIVCAAQQSAIQCNAYNITMYSAHYAHRNFPPQS